MRVLLHLLLVALALAGPRAFPAPAKTAAQGVGREEKLRLASEVEKIFYAKCTDCHDSHLPKPKGKFGFILDLKRVAANPDYIVRGEPEKSELFQMVKNDEMPGEDADVPPLTPEEKKLVEAWVRAGAPHELPEGFSLENVPVEKKTPEVKATMMRRLVNWLGKLHPASTHFPVALLMTAVLAEGVAWWLKRDEWMLLVRFLTVLGALSSVPTTVLGWFNPFPLVSGSQLETIYRFHQILGTATAVWALVCAVLVCVSECEEGSLARRRFRGALLLGAFLISVVGFLGGALNAGGLDHYKF